MLHIRTIALILTLCLFLFTACEKKTDVDESILTSSDDAVSYALHLECQETSSTVSIDDVDSSGPEKEYNDLLFEIDDCGNELLPFGDLNNEEYSIALSDLENILKNYNREVSLVAYSLDNRKALCYNTESGIFAACTIKAPYALYGCKQMENGNGSLDMEIAYEEKHFESGTGDLQYSPYGTKFSMKTIISKSLSISDNVGYMMMVDYFGREGYNDWIEKLGCPSLKIEPTVWSLRTKAKDLVVAWREIYNYFKNNSKYSKFLYDSCTNTGNNFLTASLKNTTYSHKEGHESRGDWISLSDAGIIWKENSPYIVALITNAPGISPYDTQLFSDVMEILDKNLF